MPCALITTFKGFWEHPFVPPWVQPWVLSILQVTRGHPTTLVPIRESGPLQITFLNTLVV